MKCTETHLVPHQKRLDVRCGALVLQNALADEKTIFDVSSHQLVPHNIAQTTVVMSPVSSSTSPPPPKKTKRASNETTQDERKRLLKALAMAPSDVGDSTENAAVFCRTLSDYLAKGTFSASEIHRLRKGPAVTLMRTFAVERGSGKERTKDNCHRALIQHFGLSKPKVPTASLSHSDGVTPHLRLDAERIKSAGFYWGGNVKDFFPSWFSLTFMLALDCCHKCLMTRRLGCQSIEGGNLQCGLHQHDPLYVDTTAMVKSAFRPAMEEMKLSLVDLVATETDRTRRGSRRKHATVCPHFDAVNAFELNVGFCLSEETKRTLVYPIKTADHVALLDSRTPCGGRAHNELLRRKFAPLLEYSSKEGVERLVKQLEQTMVRGDYFCFAANTVHSSPPVTDLEDPRRIFWCGFKLQSNEFAAANQQMTLHKWIKEKCGDEHKKKAKLWGDSPK